MAELPLSKASQNFIAACEDLLVLHRGIGLSQDERDVVEYYQKELPKVLVSQTKPA